MKVRRIDFSPDEWLQGTRRLDNATRGLYITACALIYSHGGPIDVDELQTVCRDHGNAFNRQLKTLLNLGKVTLANGLLDNERCENELENARKRSENASQKATNRWKNKETDDAAALLTTNYQPSEKERKKVDADKPRQPDLLIDPVKEVFDRGVRILGGRRSLIGKMVRQYGDVAVLDAIVSCESERPVDPVSFFVACLKKSTPRENGHAAQRSPVEKLWSGAKLAFEEFDRRQGDSGSGSASPGPLLDRK